jgi:hypothetical protein
LTSDDSGFSLLIFTISARTGGPSLKDFVGLTRETYHNTAKRREWSAQLKPYFYQSFNV